MSEIIHIVPGHAAGGTLKQALRIGAEDMLVFEDHLASGPIRDFGKTGDWSRIRRAYWQEIYQDYPFVGGKIDSGKEIERLGQSTTILLWVGTSLPEQLLILWIFRLFQCYNIDFSKLKLIEAYALPDKNPPMRIRGVGELNPDQLRRFYELRNWCSFEEADLTELQLAWTAVTASHPAGVEAYYLSANSHFPYLHKGMLNFMMRYPARPSGLNFYEAKLLHHTEEKGPNAVRIIGFTMGMAEDHDFDWAGDIYLFDLLKKLGSNRLPSAALMLEGEANDMRTTKIQLTDAGREYMRGESNFVQQNGINYWVGGVHLTADNIWYYENERLVAA